MNTESMNIQDIAQQLSDNPELPVKFYVDGAAIKRGYHVTEVKNAAVTSIDCGQNSSVEQWNELIIQLLDGSNLPSQNYMPAKKFQGIAAKALETLSAEDAHLLFFEFAPGNGPIRKLNVAAMDSSATEHSIYLGNEKAVCKPFQRSRLVSAATAIKNKAGSVIRNDCCS